jgi:hypothetical protein
MLIEIYRGILDILHKNSNTLRDDIKRHIRKFDDPEVYKDTEVNVCYGFWRMMLESFYNIYLHLSLGFGMLLTLILCLFAWPFTLMISVYSGILSRRVEYVDPQMLEQLDSYNLQNKKEPANGSATKRSK